MADKRQGKVVMGGQLKIHAVEKEDMLLAMVLCQCETF